jgi:cysteine desulfurase
VAAIERWLDGGGGVTADPGRVHTEGRIARAALEDARDQLAALLGTRPRQVVFTSGGTEAANAATSGACAARPGRPVVLADVEHSCVRDASARAAPMVRVGVSATGRIDLGAVEDALEACARQGEPAALVHCQSSNHEVGTTQPVAAVIAAAHRHDALVHVDACVSVGHEPLAFDDLDADLVSVSAHKFGGPPGVGALAIRRGVRLPPLLVGGDQERARRAGLENMMGIIGFAAAASVVSQPERLAVEAADARRRTNRLLAAARAVDGVTVLGDPEERAPHLVCVAVAGVEAEAVLLGLDQAGIAAHSGSSCSSESLAPSPVLEAMGADADRSLRLSVGWSTTDDDIAAFESAFSGVVTRLRALRG